MTPLRLINTSPFSKNKKNREEVDPYSTAQYVKMLMAKGMQQRAAETTTVKCSKMTDELWKHEEQKCLGVEAKKKALEEKKLLDKEEKNSVAAKNKRVVAEEKRVPVVVDKKCVAAEEKERLAKAKKYTYGGLGYVYDTESDDE
jgi:hypothetical protein